LDTIRRGTTTWVALVSLLIAAMMIGGILLFALEDFFPTLGPDAFFLVTMITVTLFIVFIVLRQKRVREIEPMPTTEGDAMFTATI